jgi:hypothetical protein
VEVIDDKHQEWIDESAKYVRLLMLPSERVPDDVRSYMTREQLLDLAADLRGHRRSVTRIIRAIEKDRFLRISDVFSASCRLNGVFNDLLSNWNQAGQEAERAAIDEEVARRSDARAWWNERKRRLRRLLG